MKEKILKYAIDKAKRNRFIQNIFEQPLDLNAFPKNGSFKDSFGNEFDLLQGLRSKLKPGWENIFKQDGKSFNKSPDRIEQIARNGRIAVERIKPIANVYLSGLKDKSILEIGCHAGGTSYAFAEEGVASITGTEFSGYKIESMETKAIEESELEQVNDNLKELRELVAGKFHEKSNISFVDDDICNSKLEKGKFDLICSWDVLEHLHDPLGAFQNVHSLLSDDGVAIHDYNPFFSIIGGHSPCTIDFPWGHVILNEEDFERFNSEKQADRSDLAMSFYRNGINRMTLKKLHEHSEEANLELLSVVTFPKEQYIRMMTDKILKLASNNYPSCELNDLVSQRVIVIQKKKKIPK
jgi:2-polyprenyl-3-methyl-5-hydroxy-6-metoxy-1,4-benzoquinol methylase